MSNLPWRPWKPSKHWEMREEQWPGVFVAEFRRIGPIANFEFGHIFFVSRKPFSEGKHDVNIIVRHDQKEFDGLTSIAMWEELRQKYGEHYVSGADGGVRSAGDEAPGQSA